MINVFDILLYQPLLNILVLLYLYLPGQDIGITIIVLTILIKILFYPLGSQAIKSQKALQDIQPKIQEIQKKIIDKEKQVQAIIELYKKEKVNPLSGILPLLVQLPILIALYRLFWRGLWSEKISSLYGFIPNPGSINPIFLGTINLSQPHLVLASIAGILQLIQTKINTSSKTEISQKKDSKSQLSETFQKQMPYFFSILTFLILLKLPSALALFWSISILFSIFQQYLVLRPQKI